MTVSRTIEDILKQYQPVLSRSDTCCLTEIKVMPLDNKYLEVEFETDVYSTAIDRSDALKLCAHLCAQFLVSFDELKIAMTPLAIEIDTIAEEMGVDIALAGVDDVN